MKPIAFLVMLGTAASLHACSSNSSLTGPSETGGAIGAGGAILAGSGGSPALGGFGGAGGMALPDDAACRPGTAYQRVTPWDLSPNQGGSKGTMGDAGFSGCVQSLNDVSCSGSAVLSSGYGGAGGATVIWDDTSRLTWVPQAADAATPPPIPPGIAEQHVWAEFKRHSVVGTALCGGGSSVTTVDLRDGPGGKLLLLSRDLEGTADLSPDDVAAVFGVGVDAVSSCSYDTVENCNAVHETLSDHVLQTDPTQTIPYGHAVQVTAPTGMFSVIWYARSEVVGAPVSSCSCSAVANPLVTFLASRVPGT